MTKATRWSGPTCAVLMANLLSASPVPVRAAEPPSPAFDVTSLQQRAAAGDAEARFALGTLYAAGYGVTQDYLASTRWLRKAADQGHAEAQCELGLLYQTSTYADVPPQDLPDAVRWYRQAADAGNGCGMLALAALYDTGQGVAHDPKQAALLYAKAAARGFVVERGALPLQLLFRHFRTLAARLSGAGEAAGDQAAR